jgi:catechol 2,3-dioxygenase-like lactoylglutathione lyase family enzyme
VENPKIAKPHNTREGRRRFIKQALAAASVPLAAGSDAAAQACSVYIGTQMINFHRPATWQRETFTLRAPAAKPQCGDLCFAWEGTPEALKTMLDRANAKVVEGPVPRQGGRRAPGSSVYVRDPDGNLLEFISYS